jgi:hypothetical protein
LNLKQLFSVKLKVKLLNKKASLFQLYKNEYFENEKNRLITFEGLRRFLKDYLFEYFDARFLNKSKFDHEILYIVLVIF